MATTPKQPQDHKTKADPVAPAKPDGWDLLKPFDQVPVWDQADLVAIVQPLMKDAQNGREPGADGVEIDVASFDMRMVGDLARKLQDCAVDKGAYVKFVSGPGALERAIDLGMWYANQLGE